MTFHACSPANSDQGLAGRFRPLVAWSSLALSLACSSDPKDRPPPYQGSSSGGPVGGGIGSGSDTAGGNDSTSDGDGGTIVEGVVERFVDTAFVLTEEYSSSAEISIMNRDDSGVTEVLYDGTSFTTERTMTSQWMAVVPEFDTSHIPTITLWDGVDTDPTLTIVPRPVLGEILGGLIDSSTVNDDRAHVMVQVLDQSGKSGVVGVVPTVSGGPNLAFEDAGVWTDADDATSESGLFLSYNIFARGLPGQDVQVILTGSADAEFNVRLAEGALTLVTYQLQ